MTAWWLNIAAALISTVAAEAFLHLSFPRALTVETTNFANRRIQSAGCIVAFAIALGVVGAWFITPSSKYLTPAVAVLGFGALGFLDDRFGNRAVSGLRGHVTAAFRGRITTGFVKLVGGAVVALVCSGLMGAHGVWIWTGAAIIALSANALNLLDTRPARATALTALFGLVCLPWSLSVVATALVWFPLDRQRKMMLGDAGSNAFGAACSVAFLAAYTNHAVQLAILIVLIAFHVWTERRSFNAFIAGRPALARIDRWIQGPPPAKP